MDLYRKIAIVVGVLYITATVAGMVSGFFFIIIAFQIQD